jgi:hypothetical protein
MSSSGSIKMGYEKNPMNLETTKTCLFRDWNTLLLEEFFSPAAAGTEVWLHTSRSELDTIGLHLGGAEGLVKAVKLGPQGLATKESIPNAVRKLVYQRRAAHSRDLSYVDPGNEREEYLGANAPTYLPYLALWVLASSEEEGGFYSKVEQLTSTLFPSLPPVTAVMEGAWKDLQFWSTEECHSRYGIFAVRVLGEHRFVGIPRSQCLVSRKDVVGIRRLFSSCGLRPRQELSETSFRQLISTASASYYLSSALRQAMDRKAYFDPLEKILGQLLKQWDGRTPTNKSATEQEQQDGPEQSDELLDDQISIVLRPAIVEGIDWEIGWRVPATVNTSACSIEIDGLVSQARLEPTGTHFASPSGLDQSSARLALGNSAVSDVQGKLRFTLGGDENGLGFRRCQLSRNSFRLLVWDAPDPRAGEALVERALPVTGPVYILCSSIYSDKLTRYLANERLATEECPDAGLPNGWTLYYIPRTDVLTSAQREWLTDGNAEQIGRARISLVGGRPIFRGGTKYFADYDLPILELEAPLGTRIECDGLKAEAFEVAASGIERSLIRRFQLKRSNSERAAFEVKAFLGIECLATVWLRVSLSSGAAVAQGREFSVDKFGRGMRSMDGLRGALIGSAAEKKSTDTTELVQIAPIDSKQRCSPLELHELTNSVAAQFLDSLAQLGSVAFGAARDQIVRLASKHGLDIQPTLLLLELRSRGHLELDTDKKGHLTRVHAVTPTIYSLPVKCNDLCLFGLTGSLRLHHWELLGCSSECGSYLVRQDSMSLPVPVLRLTAKTPETVKGIAEIEGLEFVHNPCAIVASWAGSLNQAESELSEWGLEQFSVRLEYLQRLHPQAAEFRPCTSGQMQIDRQLRSQLFRFEDPSIRGLQSYVLGTVKPDGKVAFSYIDDSRWGVWLATSGYAKMVRDFFGISDATPWPIHYEPRSGKVWIPARLKPPFVIERALTLCSGAGAAQVSVNAICSDTGVVLLDQPSARRIGEANLVYSDMASGVWLVYEWVPRNVAVQVATLLGGVLVAF